jgi:hypothetical protein
LNYSTSQQHCIPVTESAFFDSSYGGVRMGVSIYSSNAVAIPFLEMVALVEKKKLYLVIDRKIADNIVQNGTIDKFSNLGRYYRYASYATMLSIIPLFIVSYLYSWWILGTWIVCFIYSTIQLENLASIWF